MMPKRFAGYTRMVVGFLLLGTLLAGCASFPRVWWPRLPNEGLSVEAVLDYFHKADSLRTATVSKEIVRLRQVYRRQPDDETLFQLVALAMQSGRPITDRQLALQLLNDFHQRKKGSHSLMILVSILEDQLDEQLQLAGERDRARQKGQELEATSRELQDKLRALENIEKILRQREM